VVTKGLLVVVVGTTIDLQTLLTQACEALQVPQATIVLCFGFDFLSQVIISEPQL
jgi:hypothetical protein